MGCKKFHQVGHCPDLVEVRGIEWWDEKEEVAKWMQEVKKSNMIVETGMLVNTSQCYRTEYPRPCLA